MQLEMEIGKEFVKRKPSERRLTFKDDQMSNIKKARAKMIFFMGKCYLFRYFIISTFRGYLNALVRK